MPSFPNRCQHIKVNGTQCGSPALRRNRFCYFHKRHHEQRIAFSADRTKVARRRNAAIDLPVLEDANSIQVSLMQIMRLLISGQLDSKTAGLLLYALQTASTNLHQTTFEPLRHNVILDPATVAETPLGAPIWSDSDFQEDEEEEGEEESEEGEDEEEADKLEDKEESQDSAEEVSEVHTEPQRAAPKRPPTKPSAQLTGEEVRSQIRTQILKGFPSQVLERVTRENSNRTG